MTKRSIMRIAAVVVASMALSLIRPLVAEATNLSDITSSTINDLRDQISDAEEERKNLEASLSDIQAMVKKLEKEKSNLADYVTKLDQNLAEIEARIEELSAQIVAKEAEIVQTQVQLETALVEEAEQYDSMSAHIRYIYEKGAFDYLQLLLSAESFGDFLNRITYVNAMAEYDKEMLDSFIRNREFIALCKEQLDVDKKLLDETRAGVESEQKAVETLIAEKAREIELYESRISTQEQAIDEYEADLKAQTELIAQLEQSVTDEQKKILEENGVVLEYDGGDFVFPIKSYTRISSEYGYRLHPTLNVQQFHNGVDFAAPKGTHIYAAYDGVVVAATYSATMGNYVMINHGNGLYTIYMHASKLDVSKDEIVVRGEKIAEVGTTGRSTGNHLHFTVRKDGAYVSPWEYISK